MTQDMHVHRVNLSYRAETLRVKLSLRDSDTEMREKQYRKPSGRSLTTTLMRSAITVSLQSFPTSFPSNLNCITNGVCFCSAFSSIKVKVQSERTELVPHAPHLLKTQCFQQRLREKAFPIFKLSEMVVCYT